MHVLYVDEGINAIIIDNFYSQQQLQDIFMQIQDISNTEKFTKNHEHLHSAQKDGVSISKRNGVWIEDCDSALIKYPQQNFSKLYERIVSFNSMYSLLFHMNNRYHLLSYYEDAGYYNKHIDNCVFTILNYFQKEPKQYTGGDLILHSFDGLKNVTVEPKNNRVVIIPSCIVHEVSEIKMNTDDMTCGRYCLSIFLDHQYMKEAI